MTKATKHAPANEPMDITQIEINCAHDKIVPVAELTPNPRNPNKHTGEQIAWIAKLIQHRGWRSPVVVSTRSGFVVCGHGRLEAAQSIGLEGVPVDYQDFESEADEWAHMIADNSLAEMSKMDDDELAALALEIGDEFSLDLAGLDLGLLDEKPGEDKLTDTKEIPDVFEIVVSCETEEQQQEVYSRLQEEGMTCRVLTF